MSDVLGGAALLVVSAAAAAAMLLPAGRLRSAAMLFAVACFPVLILADQWNSPQISDLRDDPARMAALAALALFAAAALALAFRRWAATLPLAIVFALPFRIPLHAGGDTANLLVPLYLVIGGGVLFAASRDLGIFTAASPAGGVEDSSAGRSPPASTTGPAGQAAVWLPRVLAAVVLLYALQSLYSPDLSKSIQNVCFFFVPFSLVYALLRDVEWDRRLLTAVLVVVAVEAVAFVMVGTVEYLSESLFWNDQVIRSNDFHTYFRVNSIFWDPNIYGRYLALTIVIAMSALLWARERREQALLAILIAILWLGLVPTFSQSSFAAVLAGMAVLAALRWSVRWTLAAVAAAAVAGTIAVLFIGGSSSLNPSRLNVDTGGRANLVSGGAELFARRPVWGYGAGSFPAAYREHIATRKAPVSVSHTEPVTVAAEQGVIGLAAYCALLVCALWTMASGLFGSAAQPVGRVAVLATFVALLVHTMAYAGFYEDPITWVLLAMGATLAAAAVREPT
ncbi:MAG TPA: O-antigen ligase family protein [Solirubrobacterales bacterium]